MKKLSWAILIIFIFTSAKAQQVTSVDCCVNVGSKAMIIINDNETNAAAINLAAQSVVNKNGKCDFKLTVAANTSAGVYNAADNLIRTLWSGVRYDAGCYSLQWDGLLDDGTSAPMGSYNIKVLTNNVKYDWDTFANTTKGNNILKSYGGITSIAFAGGKLFYAHGFYEGGTSSGYLSTANIQSANDVDVGVGMIGLGATTDGINTYWLGSDQYQGGGTDGNASNYIYATKVSDNLEVVFSAATQHPSGRPGTQKMVIGWYSDLQSKQYTGITATKGASGFIFVSRADQNAVYVFSKQTGAIIKTVSIANPSLLSTAGTKLWIKSNNSLQLYDVDSGTGNLTATSVNIPNINMRAIAVNNDGSLLKYADDDSRTLKTYNGQTGAYISSFGRVNGYSGNPNVTNDAFSFYRDFANPCLAFSDDGSYWFNDAGNYRLMHFTAANSYIEQVSTIPSFRSINADPNNPSRVFIDELEYAIDYSKPLDNGTNGSWKLVKNWKENTILDAFRKFLQTITFPNGKTYAIGAGNRLYWLSETSGSILVGNIPDNTVLEADGSIYQRIDHDNIYATVQKAVLIGYTGNMPNWGSFTTIATTPNLTTTSPFNFGNNTKGSSTNTGRYFFFNPDANSSVPYILGGAITGNGYHLGAIKTGGNTWDWQASKSTFGDYHGDYPRNGDFDVGNNDYYNQHSENCQALVQESDIFWNVNAEFWQANSGASGVNIWNHFNEDGLLIGNFGTTAVEARLNGELKMAGNSFSTAIVKVGADYYIYHCDESRWGSGHRWKVSGLNTIKEVSIPVAISASITEISDPTDLMVGLPFLSGTFQGGNGWSVQSGTNLRTNRLQYAKNNLDIALGGSNNLTITRTLNNITSLASWKLTAGIGYQNSEKTFGNAPDGSDNFHYLEILDVSGKIIARFIGDEVDTRNNYYPRVWVNSTIVAEGPAANNANYTYFRDISFSYANGTLTFKHQDYPSVSVTTPFEAGADLSKPATLRVNQSGNRVRYINMYKLKFIPNTVLL